MYILCTFYVLPVWEFNGIFEIQNVALYYVTSTAVPKDQMCRWIRGKSKKEVIASKGLFYLHRLYCRNLLSIIAFIMTCQL